jgi:hypothetical protein
MKLVLFSAILAFSMTGFSQNLQVHYDFRHALDPALNEHNYPTFSFEYFKNLDTAGTGSFLMKLQADMNGKNNNIGQVFTQLSQSLRFWIPKVYLSLNYSGGLGVTSTASGYYLANSFGIGIAYPFQWQGAWLSASVLFRYNAFDKPSYDPQFTLYFGKGFCNYKIFIAGSVVCWTQNKNQGNEFTRDLHGKKLAFFGDPQVWFRIKNGISAGSRGNVYYNLIGRDNKIQLYPTLGLKYQF